MITLMLSEMATPQAWALAIIEVLGAVSGYIIAIINAIKARNNANETTKQLSELKQRRQRTLRNIQAMMDAPKSSDQYIIARESLKADEGI